MTNLTIPTIGYAYGHASRNPNAAQGPTTLQQTRLPHTAILQWQNMIICPQASAQKEAALSDVQWACTQLSQAVRAACQKPHPFLVIGGDHSCAIGTWHGAHAGYAEPIGLIWLDAHLDSHTPESSHSRNIHGMPLATLLGYGYPELINLSTPAPILNPQDLAIIGFSDYEPEEWTFIQKNPYTATH